MTDAELMAVLNERDRLRAEAAEQKAISEVQAALNGTLRAEIRRQMDEIAEQKQLNLQLAERLAACSAVLSRAAERGKVRECQTHGDAT